MAAEQKAVASANESGDDGSGGEEIVQCVWAASRALQGTMSEGGGDEGLGEEE